MRKEQDNESPGGRSEAAVVVLGDIGRSPRMCNHAKMLADEGFLVKIVGFYDSTPGKQIREHPRIRIVGIPPPPDFLDTWNAMIQLPLKLLWNFVTLLFALLFKTSAFNLRVILMQNPPALPTMMTCYLVSVLKCAKFSIDWHNYMFSILQDKYNLTAEHLQAAKSRKAKIVNIVSFLEGLCGRLSDYNLCVTDAMRNDLIERWGVHASTFYDRPPTWKFKKTTLNEIHDLYRRLSKTDEGSVLRGEDETSTILTRLNANNSVTLLKDRPIVLLSSTSWTPDEKFDILLDALVDYDKTRSSETGKGLPRILMIITGKGPLKASYLEEIRQKQLQNVDILTPWLEADDYPRILASADLGISLHTSTSGLDLPMKVVDMFGAKVPVLAKRFRCIHELVKEDFNGYLFDDHKQLSHHISELSRGFPVNCTELIRLKSNIEKTNFESWEVMWKAAAAPGARLTLQDDSSFKLRAKIQISVLLCFFILPLQFIIGRLM